MNSGIGAARIFDCGASIRKLHAIQRDQKLSKGEIFLCDKNTLEWKIRSLGVRLVRKHDVAEEGRLEPKVNVLKICFELWRRGEETQCN